MGFQPKTIKELLDWSYANLAAYQVAISHDPPAYDRLCWMTRSRIYKGLQSGSMKRQTLYTNERVKLLHSNECAYCGIKNVPMTLDHLFAKSRQGSDSGDNLVYCCRSCNSSKRDMDYFEWIEKTGRRVNIEIAERYLKNAYSYCEREKLLDEDIENAPYALPFNLKSIPLQYNLG